MKERCYTMPSAWKLSGEGKRHGSRKWEEENPSRRRLPRAKESKDQKTPSPPYNVPHPIGHPQGGHGASAGRVALFVLLCISQTPEMHPRPFFLGFWHPRWSFAGVVPHPHWHPRASARLLCTCGDRCKGFGKEF